MTTQPNTKEMADYFKLGLRLGLLDQSPVIIWADALIHAQEKPDISIIELSLSGGRSLNDTIACLGNIKGEANTDTAIKLTLAHLWREVKTGRMSLDAASVILYRLKDLATAQSDVIDKICTLDENLSLAEDGVYGSIEEALNEIRDYLKEQQGYEMFLPEEV